MSEENRLKFEAYVQEAWKRELSNSQAYDKAVLTLSSAALGLSLTAFDFEKIECVGLIYGSWVLLIFAIITTLVSFIIGNKALNKYIDKAEDYYIQGNEKAFKNIELYEKINTYLNSLSGTFLIVGIIMMVLFKAVNL